MKKGDEISFDSQFFKGYLEGSLSKEETVNFERLIDANPFYKDALDGLKENPESIDVLRRLEKKNVRFYKISPIFFYSGFVFVFFIATSVFLFNNQNVKIEESSFITVSEMVINQRVVKSPFIEKDQVQQIEELTDLNIEKSIPKEVEKQVQSKKLIEDYELKGLQKDSFSAYDEQKITQIERVAEKPMFPILNKEKKRLQTETVPLTSMYGLITINYSKIETNFLIKKRQLTYTGLTADAENSSSQEKDFSHEISVHEIPYDKYFSEIQHSFSQNKFKKALKGYKEVLKQYPNDLNAHFYSGLCYFNINQSQKAIEHFEVVKVHQYNTFRQEGEWYTAQALFDLNRNEEGIVLLNKIIERSGFYVDQAKRMEKEVMQ